MGVLSLPFPCYRHIKREINFRGLVQCVCFTRHYSLQQDILFACESFTIKSLYIEPIIASLIR